MYTIEINEWIAEAKEAERQCLSNAVHYSEENCREDGISESEQLGSSGNLRPAYRNTSNVV